MTDPTARYDAPPHLDGETQLVALLGHPVEHSRSPLLHNTAFRAQGLNWAYVATPVLPGRVADALAGLVALGFRGANVTIPHKEAVFERVDERSDAAEAVGAVNTVVVRRGATAATLYGDNTDVEGFLAPLRPRADGLAGAEVVVFGAGGAARAVAYALLAALTPARLTLVARTPARAERLAADLAPFDRAGSLAVAPLAAAGGVVRRARLVVNATPAGMHPHVESTPWPEAAAFGPDHLVYDLVYNPARTRLLAEAEARGARTLGGLEMLIAQAAASYVQWTGRPMPTEAVRAVLSR